MIPVRFQLQNIFLVISIVAQAENNWARVRSPVRSIFLVIFKGSFLNCKTNVRKFRPNSSLGIIDGVSILHHGFNMVIIHNRNHIHPSMDGDGL